MIPKPAFTRRWSNPEPAPTPDGVRVRIVHPEPPRVRRVQPAGAADFRTLANLDDGEAKLYCSLLFGSLGFSLAVGTDGTVIADPAERVDPELADRAVEHLVALLTPPAPPAPPPLPWWRRLLRRA